MFATCRYSESDKGRRAQARDDAEMAAYSAFLRTLSRDVYDRVIRDTKLLIQSFSISERLYRSAMSSSAMSRGEDQHA
jgi:hypothetical protein